jgi:hypothetical protein
LKSFQCPADIVPVIQRLLRAAAVR